MTGSTFPWMSNKPLVDDKTLHTIARVLGSTAPDYIKFADVMTVLNGNELTEMWAEGLPPAEVNGSVITPGTCQLVDTVNGKKMWDMKATCPHTTCGFNGDNREGQVG